MSPGTPTADVTDPEDPVSQVTPRALTEREGLVPEKSVVQGLLRPLPKGVSRDLRDRPVVHLLPQLRRQLHPFPLCVPQVEEVVVLPPTATEVLPVVIGAVDHPVGLLFL